jgi:hypothetical protein
MYVLEGPKGTSEPLTCSFAAFNYAVDAADPFSSWITGVYQSVVEQAIQTWASVSGLVFQQVPDSANPSTSDDIRIGFATLKTASTGDIGETNYKNTGGNFDPDVIIRLEDPSQVPLISTSAGLTYQGYKSTFYQVVLHELGTRPRPRPFVRPQRRDVSGGNKPERQPRRFRHSRNSSLVRARTQCRRYHD